MESHRENAVAFSGKKISRHSKGCLFLYEHYTIYAIIYYYLARGVILSNLDLLALLEQEANEICSGFELARLEGKGTPQEVADRNEFVIQSFFKKYYPIPYWVTKGNIVDSYNNRSCSVDCVILNPSHPHTFVREVNKPSIIFADGVDFAIEIKPDLRNKNLYDRT